MGAAAVRTRGVSKRFGSREALRGVTLEIPAGSCFAIFGPNGSGKTTLVRILSTLAVPSEGEVEVAGCPLPARAVEARARIGTLLDHHFLPRDFSLDEGLLYYADLHGIPSPRARIDALAERMGLAWRLRDPVRTFSRGMAQRAGLMRALLHDPEVLLLDEPFTALDPSACRVVEGVIAETRSRGRTVVLVTHDVARGAELADAAAVLVDGRLVYQGPPAGAAEKMS